LSLYGVKIDEVLYSGDTDGSGNLTGHRWPCENHLGSVIVVLDNDAVVKSDYDYTVYGEATNGGSEAYPYQFTGRRIIEGLGLLDYRTRIHEPKVGRFLARDVIGTHGDPKSLGNGQAYAGNDPVNVTDPLGLAEGTISIPLHVGADLPPGVRVAGELVRDPQPRLILARNPFSGELELLEWNPHSERWETVSDYLGLSTDEEETILKATVVSAFALGAIYFAGIAIIESIGAKIAADVSLAAKAAAASPGIAVAGAITLTVAGPPGQPGIPVPPWVTDAGSFVNWLKNLQRDGTKLTKESLDFIIRMAGALGVKVRRVEIHPGTPWDTPHINIGRKGQVHLPVPEGYEKPQCDS
jgi:RHS repeat-associated protein